MTAEISPDAMRVLRPHLDSAALADETLRQLSDESGVSFAELAAARDALWANSLGRPSDARTGVIEALEGDDQSGEGPAG